jgi:hypothetical protein
LWSFPWRFKGFGGFKQGANVNSLGNGVGSVAFFWSVLPFNPTDISRAQLKQALANPFHMLASRVVVVRPKIDCWGSLNNLLKRFVSGVASCAVSGDSGDANRPKGFGALFTFNDDHEVSVLKFVNAVKGQVSDFQVALRFAPIGVSPNEGLLAVALNALMQRDQSAVGVANFKGDASFQVLFGSQVSQGNAKCVANSVNGATREAMK